MHSAAISAQTRAEPSVTNAPQAMAEEHARELGVGETTQQNRETAIHMERIAAILRNDLFSMDTQEHGMDELAAARKACADELRAAANKLNPQEAETVINITGLPEKSTTEIVIHGIHKDMTGEDIAHILGGGRWVRMVRLGGEMAFVSYWTEKGQLRGLKDGPRWIREAGWMAKQAEPANFNDKYHMFEIDEKEPSPPYHRYPNREDNYDHTEASGAAESWATSSTTTTTEHWHQKSLPRTFKKRKVDMQD